MSPRWSGHIFTDSFREKKSVCLELPIQIPINCLSCTLFHSMAIISLLALIFTRRYTLKWYSYWTRMLCFQGLHKTSLNHNLKQCPAHGQWSWGDCEYIFIFIHMLPKLQLLGGHRTVRKAIYTREQWPKLSSLWMSARAHTLQTLDDTWCSGPSARVL